MTQVRAERLSFHIPKLKERTGKKTHHDEDFDLQEGSPQNIAFSNLTFPNLTPHQAVTRLEMEWTKGPDIPHGRGYLTRELVTKQSV